MAVARFAGTPRMPKASKNSAFEALGGQVGHEHVLPAIWTEKARHLAPQVIPRGCQKKTNCEDFLVPFFGPHSECTFGGFQTRNGSQNVTQNGALPEMAEFAQV